MPIIVVPITCLYVNTSALLPECFRLFQGGDADTNGAAAGALLGCKLGVNNLPPTWIGGLRHKDWLDDIIQRYDSLYDDDITQPTTAQSFSVTQMFIGQPLSPGITEKF